MALKVSADYLHLCLWFLVPGSSRDKDALADTIPPAPPVLRSLFNLVPADAQYHAPMALRYNAIITFQLSLEAYTVKLGRSQVLDSLQHSGSDLA